MRIHTLPPNSLPELLCELDFCVIALEEVDMHTLIALAGRRFGLDI
jgi:hypothetical protein